MRVAIPLFRKRISPNFLTAPELQVVLAHGQKADCTFLFRFPRCSSFERRKKILSLGIDLLICGGIDWPTKFWLERHGIKVIDNTRGEVEEILSHLPIIPEGVTKGEKSKTRKKFCPGKKKEGSHAENLIRG